MTAPIDWTDNQLDPTHNIVNAEKLIAIDVLINAKYVKPGTGIPKTDLEAAVQASLDLADTALQPIVVNPQVNNYTLTLADVGKAIEINKATAVNLTIPLNSSVPIPVGRSIPVIQIGAGQITVIAIGGVTVNTTSTAKTRAQWSTIILTKRGTDAWLISGDVQ